MPLLLLFGKLSFIQVNKERGNPKLAKQRFDNLKSLERSIILLFPHENNFFNFKYCPMKAYFTKGSTIL